MALLAASCTSGSSDGSADTLLTGGRPATTAPAGVTTTTAAVDTTTTTAPPTTTTSVVTATSKAATTSTSTTVQVAAGDADTGGTLVQLPLTGPEPGVAVLALLALITGVWLLRWSWQERRVIVNALLWSRSPAGEWPPDAVAPQTTNDRRFRRAARRHARRYGVSFVGGAEAYATRWASQHHSVEEIAVVGIGQLADWRRAMAEEARRIYG